MTRFVFSAFLFITGSVALGQMLPIDIVNNSGSAHVDVEKVGLRKVMHGVVTTTADRAEFTFDGRVIQFGDGFAITRQTLVNDSVSLVVRLTASAPDGAAESAIIVRNRQSGVVSSTDFGRFAKLLDRSGDARIIRAVLSASSRTRIGSNAFDPAPMTLDCTKYALAFVTATLSAEVACGTGNVPGCAAALLAVAIAADGMATSCPSNGAEDGTIGWG